MKTKLLLTFLLISFISNAQVDIASYTSTPNSNYAIVTPTGTVDETASGANQTWNFTSLTQVGNVQDIYAVPTAAELTTYPGTTNVLSVTNTANSEASVLFIKEDATGTSITGADQDGLNLNYSTDNALIGLLPLSFNYDNTDNVAGTFSGTFNGIAASGTFSGTINAAVDAYGTLNINDLGAGAYSDAVTRLKVVQDLDLSITSPFPVAATGDQTTYNYYDDVTGELILRSSVITVSAPTLGFSETTERIEVFKDFVLSTDNEIFKSNVVVYPNPVNDILKLDISGNYNLESLKVYSVQGQLLETKNENLSSLDVSKFNAGVYFVQLISTDGKRATKTFVKR